VTEIIAAPLPMTVASATATDAANLLNERLGRAASFTSGQQVTFDLGSSQPINCAAILATDAASSGVTWRVELSNNAGMTPLVYDSGVVSIWASPEAGKRVHRSGVLSFAETSARYVRVTAASISGTLKVGRFMVANAFTPDEPRDFGWDQQIVDLGEARRSSTGLDDPAVRGKVMEFSWAWTGLTRAEANGLMMDLLAYAGTTRDVLVCLDTDAADRHNMIGYGKLTDKVPIINPANDWYEAKFALLSRLVLAL
jgi:hypothetical protein